MFIEAETYSKEFLKPKTERLNDKMLNDMLKRYDNEDMQDEEVQIKEAKLEDDLMIDT